MIYKTNISQILFILMSIFYFNEHSFAGDLIQGTIEKNETLSWILTITTAPHHHFNLDAPNSIKISGSELYNKPTNLTSVNLKLPITIKSEISGKLFVCDDKKTFCSPQTIFVPFDEFNKQTQSSSQNKIILATLDFSKKINDRSQNKIDDSEIEMKHGFYLNTPEFALKKAAATNKNILIDFYATWCPPCNILDETVFPDKNFQKIAKNFTLLKLDADSSISWNLKSKFKIQGYPTLVITNAKGDEQLRFSGALSVRKLTKLMKQSLTLKSKNLSELKSEFDQHPNTHLAQQLFDIFFMQEDFENALVYLPSLDHNSSQYKENSVILPLFLAFPSADKNKNTSLSKSFLQAWLLYPKINSLYFYSFNSLKNFFDSQTDKAMKDKLNSLNIEKISKALKTKSYSDALEKVDDLGMIALSQDELSDFTASQKTYSLIVSEYDELIKNFKQDPSMNRGFNLERIYALYKSGKTEDAKTNYETLIKSYPTDFTFYYNYASVLKELKQWSLALEQARKALKYSYGDNKLRATYLVSEALLNTNQADEAFKTIDSALNDVQLPEDTSLRSHRYVKKLKELKNTIESKIKVH